MLFQIFLQALLDSFVGIFYLPITLEMPKEREHFVYPELFTEGDEFRIVKQLSVICDYGM